MKKTVPSATMRLFVAAALPPKTRDALVRQQAKFRRAQPRVSWVPPENLHLSLVFLGDVLLREAAQLPVALDDVCRRYAPFALEVKHVGWFGSVRHPSVLWAGLEGERLPVLMALQDEVSASLRNMGLHVEKRAYSPHITFGRIRGPRNLAELTLLADSAKTTAFGSLTINRILLMRSILHARGAEHVLQHASLLEGEEDGKIRNDEK